MEADLFPFYSGGGGGTLSQMNLTKSQNNVPVRVRYGNRGEKPGIGWNDTILW